MAATPTTDLLQSSFPNISRDHLIYEVINASSNQLFWSYYYILKKNAATTTDPVRKSAQANRITEYTNFLKENISIFLKHERIGQKESDEIIENTFSVLNHPKIEYAIVTAPFRKAGTNDQANSGSMIARKLFDTALSAVKSQDTLTQEIAPISSTKVSSAPAREVKSQVPIPEITASVIEPENTADSESEPQLQLQQSETAALEKVYSTGLARQTNFLGQLLEVRESDETSKPAIFDKRLWSELVGAPTNSVISVEAKKTGEIAAIPAALLLDPRGDEAPKKLALGKVFITALEKQKELPTTITTVVKDIPTIDPLKGTTVPIPQSGIVPDRYPIETIETDRLTELATILVEKVDDSISATLQSPAAADVAESLSLPLRQEEVRIESAKPEQHRDVTGFGEQLQEQLAIERLLETKPVFSELPKNTQQLLISADLQKLYENDPGAALFLLRDKYLAAGYGIGLGGMLNPRELIQAVKQQVLPSEPFREQLRDRLANRRLAALNAVRSHQTDRQAIPEGEQDAFKKAEPPPPPPAAAQVQTPDSSYQYRTQRPVETGSAGRAASSFMTKTVRRIVLATAGVGAAAVGSAVAATIAGQTILEKESQTRVVSSILIGMIHKLFIS